MLKKTACLLLLTSLFVSISPLSVCIPQVNAWNGQTIYIHANGSVDPTSAPIQRNGDIYTLTDNITTTGDGIIIERNSTILDGNGHAIQTSLSGNGIDISKTNYVTVKNATIQGFYIGIFAPRSGYDNISGNTIAQNSIGIWLDGSSNDNLIGNNITQNTAYNIWITSSSNNNIYHNNFVNNPSQQVYTDSINTWDAGYPSGGNYWSDYTGFDYFSGPYQNITGSDGIGDTPYVINANNPDRYPFMNPLLPVMPIECSVGITGYKLLFNETIVNSLSSQVTIDYYWSFSVEKWSGTQWISAGISGSTPSVVGLPVPTLTAVDLPYSVYLLSSSAVGWGDWLRISYTFHWTYSGTSYSIDYSTKLHVHPGDIAGAAAITPPYFGADQHVGIDDVNPVAWYWGKTVSWTGTIDPTDTLHIASISGENRIGVDDINPIAYNWGKTWTNTTPP
jgi:parallel beta-helix repeat protein